MPYQPRPSALALALATAACVVRLPADTSATDGSSTGSTGDPDATTSGPSTDPTTGSPTTGTSTTSGASTGPTCEPYTATVAIPLIVPHLMLVVDQSPAMGDPWDHDADPQTPDRPRWQSVRAALEDILPQSAADEFAVGLARYPDATVIGEYGAQACTSDPAAIIPPALGNTDALLAALAPTDATLVGAAPLRPALAGALAELAEVPPDLPRGVVVVTASAPNCSEGAPDLDTLLETLDPAVVPLVDDAIAGGANILFVYVGATDQPNPDGADMRPDGVSVAGAYGRLFSALDNAADEAQLRDRLTWLLTNQSDSTCSVMIDPAPDPDQHVAEVRVDGQPIPGPLDFAGCQAGDGWMLEAPDTIYLCGAACPLFQDTGDLEIDVACGP